ncbi:MAG: hypothetical protein QOC99_3643 [Acidobacteriota bacterium]|nr:hypothetical protein [Acidobacteriota bacterium]
MNGKALALLHVAALVIMSAALRTPAQRPSQRKAAPHTSVEQVQPKKVSIRPEDEKKPNDAPVQKTGDASSAGAAAKPKEDPNSTHYVYEFRQPDFFVYFIHIEHDETGRGLIRFERRSDTEQITDPIEFSPTALARIQARFNALNFLDSAAGYQGERTYPSQGQTRLTLRQGGRERTAEFNYSQNADAQALAEEYRRAGEQALFVFQAKVALESQPLELPKLLNGLESLIERNYLSDKQQLIPLVRELSEDERVPLVGRNQAARILKKLEKQTQ